MKEGDDDEEENDALRKGAETARGDPQSLSELVLLLDRRKHRVRWLIDVTTGVLGIERTAAHVNDRQRLRRIGQ